MTFHIYESGTGVSPEGGADHLNSMMSNDQTRARLVEDAYETRGGNDGRNMIIIAAGPQTGSSEESYLLPVKISNADGSRVAETGAAGDNQTTDNEQNALRRMELTAPQASPDEAAQIKQIETALISGKMSEFQSALSEVPKSSLDKVIDGVNKSLIDTRASSSIKLDNNGNILVTSIAPDGTSGTAMSFTPDGDFREHFGVHIDGQGDTIKEELRGGDLPANLFLSISDRIVDKLDDLPESTARPQLFDHSGDGRVR